MPRAVVTASRPNGDAEDGPGRVSLCVLNPEGMFFNQDVRYSEEEHKGGTWH